MKPFPMNTEEVRGTLDGRRTMIRRVMKPQPTERLTSSKELLVAGDAPYRRGDALYVRETWRIQNYGYDTNTDTYDEQKLEYRADFSDIENEMYGRRGGCALCRWFPSIHMPREAARLFLRVTAVRVERLQEATLYGFLDEGVSLRPEAFNDPDNAYLQARHQFSDIWDSTIKKPDLPLYGWESNPWVWVIDFERCENPCLT